MAIVTYRPGIFSIHGRIGNVIFQRWNHLNICRSYTPPRYTRTPAQAGNRDKFKALVSLWQSLGPAEVRRWNAVAIGYGRKGYARFMALNLPRLHRGEAPLLRPLRHYPGLGLPGQDRFSKKARSIPSRPPTGIHFRRGPLVGRLPLRVTPVGPLRSPQNGRAGPPIPAKTRVSPFLSALFLTPSLMP